VLGVTADTNVYISALNFGGKPLELLEHARSGRVKLSLSEPILAEIARVSRDKFHWEHEPLRAVQDHLRGFTETITPTQTLDVITYDESDNRILECATAAKPEYIVSGDRDLLRLRSFEGIPILRVGEFLDLAEFHEHVGTLGPE
jgi:putative PIN family toxin of toxin-antitoxin system